MDKLHLGCGNNYLEGYINVDTGNCKKDVDWDLTNIPFDFKDESFSEVFSQHCFEHLPKKIFFDFFKEIHRILKPQGLLRFCVPIAGSDNFWTDPTHQMPFTPRTMDYITNGKILRENGIIYGADYEFIEVSPPYLDQNQTLYFNLLKG